jgi:hypothetical protein
MVPLNVFLKCPCGRYHSIDGATPDRIGLAIFRGSEHRLKCNGCGTTMDTMGAFIGEFHGSEVVRHDDPKFPVDKA